jgi:hypothetical protein
LFESQPLDSGLISRTALDESSRLSSSVFDLLSTYDGRVWLNWGVYYHFFMDAELVETVAKMPSKISNQLQDWRDWIYERAVVMAGMCRARINYSLKDRIDNDGQLIPIKPGEEISIKNDVIRPFYYALCAMRVNTGIREVSMWQILRQAEAIGIIDAGTRQLVEESLKFFIGLRHSIGINQPQAIDTNLVSKDLRVALSAERKISIVEFDRQLANHANYLLGIARRISIPTQ